MIINQLVSEEEFQKLSDGEKLRCEMVITLSNGQQFKQGFAMSNLDPTGFETRLAVSARTIANMIRSKTVSH